LQGRQEEPLEYIRLFDADATRDRIGSTLADILPTLKAQDQLLLYLCGTGVMAQPSDQLNGRTGFVCYDGARGTVRTKGGSESGALEGIFTDTDFRDILASYNKNDAYITCIFDACNMGSATWIDLHNPRQVLMTASRLSETTVETPELKGGVFTQTLLDVVGDVDGQMTYHQLWGKIDQQVRAQLEQHVQLFGHTTALRRMFLSSQDFADLQLRLRELWDAFFEELQGRDPEADLEEARANFQRIHQAERPEDLVKALEHAKLLNTQLGFRFLLALAPDRFGTLDELARIMSELDLDFDIHEIQNYR
jgi:hypothetical protein